MRALSILIAMAWLGFALPAQADIICDWVELAGRGLDGKALPPPPLQDQVSRTAPPTVALAMFEAANRIDRRYQSYLGLARAPAGASADAAVVAAGHAVLLKLRPELRVGLDHAMLVALAHVPDGPARTAGIAIGEDSAAAALARTLFDGPALEPYRPFDQIGRFAPPIPPAFAPWSLRGKPYFLTSNEEVMPPPPPALTSEIYARDFNETRTIGGVGQPGATPMARAMATYISGFSLDPMLRGIADAKPRLVDRARFWALVRMAQHDATTMTGIAKMRYMAWRPFNAIRNADKDDNPATERDATWMPVLPTPNHPEYPCGHCVASGVIAGLLEPETKGPISVASDAVDQPAGMTFVDWPAFLAATSLARIQGGMHFRFSNDAGQAMGEKIAALARQRFAPLLAGKAR